MRLTIALLLLGFVFLLAPIHVTALTSRNYVSRQSPACVRWQLASYTLTPINGPTGKLFEYYVTWTDGRGNYQASNVLAAQRLSALALASLAPVTCT